MTFLPIVDRELRVAARRPRTYWIRVAAAGVGLLIAGWMIATLRLFGGVGVAGQLIFAPLNSLAFLYCLLAGVCKTADCLSEEKREGTLGLLFLTDLKGHDVVLGKIAATSLHWLYGLLAVFPMMAMGMLAGGVTPGEFWRAILALVNTLFFSLAAGMLVSACSRNERKAALGVVVLLFFLWAIPTWIGEWRMQVRGTSEPWPGFKLAWPGQAHDYAADGLYRRSPRVFWDTLHVSHLAGWLMLALASVILRRAWQEKAATVRASRWAQRRQRWTFGGAKTRAAFRRRLLDLNPVLWLGARELRKRQWVYATLFLSAGYFIGHMLLKPADWTAAPSYFMPAFFLQVGLKIWIAFEACRRFVDDRRSGALELMLVTPLGVPQILLGQWRALWRQFGGPVAVLFLFDLFLVWSGLGTLSGSVVVMKRSQFLSMFAAGIAVFLLDVWTLAWLGMRLGLVFRHAYAAAGSAIGMILVAPWVLFYMGMTGVMMVVFWMNTAGKGRFAPTFNFDFTVELAAAGWFLLSLAAALSLGLWARRTLLRDFRALATQEKKLLISRPKARIESTPGPLPPRLPGV